MALKIGDLANATGTKVQTIRYYEEIGLVSSPARRGNGYRDYGDDDLRVLLFLKRARGLGFGVEDCRELLALYRDRTRKSAAVKTIALARITDIDRKIEDMKSLRAALLDMSERCHGGDRPDCPIIGALSAAHAGA